jgi:hypothetical protein
LPEEVTEAEAGIKLTDEDTDAINLARDDFRGKCHCKRIIYTNH